MRKSTSICVEIYGYDNLYLLRFEVRVFSQKQSSSFVGNVDVYSVGTESVYPIVQYGRTECFASVSREDLTCEILAKHSCLHLY